MAGRWQGQESLFIESMYLEYRSLLKSDGYEHLPVLMPFDHRPFVFGNLRFADLCRLEKAGVDVEVYTKTDDGIKWKSLGRLDINHRAEMTINYLLSIPCSRLAAIRSEATYAGLIAPHNIPQFSNLAAGTDKLVQVLLDSGDYGPTFAEIGKYLLPDGKKHDSYRKYGENHAKLASLLDLAWITPKSRRVYATPLGVKFLALDEHTRQLLLGRLVLFIPIVEKCFKERLNQDDICRLLEQFVAPSTAARRRPNIQCLLSLVSHYGEVVLDTPGG